MLTDEQRATLITCDGKGKEAKAAVLSQIEREDSEMRVTLAFCDGVLLVLDGENRAYNPEGVKEARRRIAGKLNQR